jgi:hypothetical protein
MEAGLADHVWSLEELVSLLKHNAVRGSSVSKRAVLCFAAVVGISTVYDFYRGHHQTHSIIGGVVYLLFGLVVLAFFWWLYSKRPSSD